MTSTPRGYSGRTISGTLRGHQATVLRFAVHSSGIRHPSSFFRRPSSIRFSDPCSTPLFNSVQQSEFNSQKTCNCFPGTESKDRDLQPSENRYGACRPRNQEEQEGRANAGNEADRWTGRQNLDNRAAPVSARKCERKGQNLSEISGSFPGGKTAFLLGTFLKRFDTKQPFCLTPWGTATYNN